MMATVGHVTSSSGLRKFQTDGFLLGRVYWCWYGLKLGTSEREIQGHAFIVAASGGNESEAVSVNEDRTPVSVLMSNKTNR